MNTSKYIKKFSITGFCEIDIDIVVNGFTSTDFISQWKEEYTLFFNNAKLNISKKDAHNIIGQVGLKDTPSPIFKNGRTWKL